MENKSRFCEAKSSRNFVESFSGKAVQSHGHQTARWRTLGSCSAGAAVVAASPRHHWVRRARGRSDSPWAPPLSTPRTASGAQFY